MKKIVKGVFMNILISGGSRGIGRACVERFSSPENKIAFIYKSSHDSAKQLAEALGAIPICADISKPDDTNRALGEAVSVLGSIDVLVNNAGISQIKLFTDITNSDWRAMIDNNLSSAFYLTRAVLPHMIAQKSGRIINIGSMWGKTGASCEVHYSATKAALRGFTMALAKEVGPSGITVNAIEPGVIMTDMCESLDNETLSALAEETPLCRLGKPNDVAALAYFLASDGASFITGQIIGVDGGFAI